METIKDDQSGYGVTVTVTVTVPVPVTVTVYKQLSLTTAWSGTLRRK